MGPLFFSRNTFLNFAKLLVAKINLKNPIDSKHIRTLEFRAYSNQSDVRSPKQGISSKALAALVVHL
jgi:hypothetical protein